MTENVALFFLFVQFCKKKSFPSLKRQPALMSFALCCTHKLSTAAAQTVFVCCPEFCWHSQENVITKIAWMVGVFSKRRAGPSLSLFTLKDYSQVQFSCWGKGSILHFIFPFLCTESQSTSFIGSRILRLMWCDQWQAFRWICSWEEVSGLLMDFSSPSACTCRGVQICSNYLNSI